MALTEDDVLAALSSEQKYCQNRWGGNPKPFNKRSLDEWVLYLGEYIAEARAQTVRGDEEAAIHTIRKITNLGFNCMQQHGAPLRI